jgi:glycosyltransferase involved in cell wall biosynthesis
MQPELTIAIPAHNEEKFIGKAIESAFRSGQLANRAVEVVVALNRCTDRTQHIAESLGAKCVVEDQRIIAAVRNAAVRGGTAPAVATLDADSWMAPGTVAEVLRKVHDPRFIGGGSFIRFERMSVGIFFSIMAVVPHMLRQRVSAGMFWFQRQTFEHLGGFDESLISVEDVDFAMRLKAHGEKSGQQYGTIYKQCITTSCRKFDQFGDWYLFKNPQLVRGIFTGKDRKSADAYYYDVKR